MQPKRTSLLPVFATLLTLLVVGSFLGVFVVFPLLETNTFLKQAQDSLNRTHNTAADLVKAIDKIAQEDLQRDPSESTILSLTLPRKLTPPPDEKYTGTVAGTTDEPSELVLDPELETQVNLNENALKKLSKAKESLIDLKKLRLPEFLFFGAQDLKNDFDVYSDGFESLINYSEGVIMYNDLTVEVGITLENLGVGLDAAFATGDPVVIKREMDQLQIELRDLEGSLDKAKVPEDAVALHENGKEIISLLRSFFDSLNRAIETSDLELLEHAYNSFLVDMITIGKKTDDATKSFWRKTKFADDFQELEINKKTLEITIEAVQSNPIFKALRPFAY